MGFLCSGPSLGVGKHIAPGFGPYIVPDASLAVRFDAEGEFNLMLTLIQVLDKYNIIAAMDRKTVLQDSKVYFGKPFEQFV